MMAMTQSKLEKKEKHIHDTLDKFNNVLDLMCLASRKSGESGSKELEKIIRDYKREQINPIDM